MKIETKYHGPGNVRGARISVKSYQFGRKTFPFDHSAACAHDAAVIEYCAVHGIDDEFVKGPNHDDTGWVYLSVRDNVRLKVGKE